MNDRKAAPAALEMPKGFEHAPVEERWAAAWEEHEIGRADNDSTAPPFAMVIPPPNVTGALHLGHGLDQTLQDLVARYRRMSGDDVLWLPGMDHAGIATQNVVERALAAEGLDRRTMGREAFLERAWEWKEQYGGRILVQMRRLGLSVDWSRLRFTLDPGMSRAVRRVFVDLYEQGLIYRGEYMVNWCPKDQTAISDLEVKHEEVDGKLWKIRYALLETEGAPSTFLEVETTRPETMLGDTALAVNPKDARYADLVGRTAMVPLVGREIPVIADDFVDAEFGTGVVKVTPAHDPNDYEAGVRHELPRVQVIGTDGKMTEAAGEFAGQDRFEARDAVLAALRRDGLLVGTRPHRHAVGHSERSGAVIEPLISTQWFVRTAPLAEAAMAAAERGDVRFHPDNQFKIFREWMTNIRDWCISRQLWWGHQIPAWHNDETGEIYVGVDDPDPALGLRRDPDVLDTWFSSGLFPFSTMGWPDETKDLARYYPTGLLVTGYDILFFWVARMVMLGLHFRQEAPFKDVFLHGLIRDADGVKMSKSRGNGVDPVDMIDKYGADALRFMLIATATPGTDLIFSEERVAGYRAFANKLWNATRFSLMNLGDEELALQASADAADPAARSMADRWILSRLAGLLPRIERNLDKYRFDEAAQDLYQFIWHEFCDWYLEMAKVVFNSDDETARRESRGTLLAALEILLRALHPMMPFITEDLWSRLPGDRGLLSLAPWAAAQEEWLDPEAESLVTLLQGVATEVRRLRAEVGVEPRREVDLVLVSTEAERREELAAIASTLRALVRAGEIQVVEAEPEMGERVAGVTGDVEVLMSLEGAVDIDKERERLGKALAKVEGELSGLQQRLGNDGFTKNAPAEVVQKVRDRHTELEAECERLRAQAASLEA
jgi:valyl-tRNA synthetase